MHLTIVVPAYNEAANIAPLYQRLAAAAQRCADSYDVLFVDDGSTDGTADAVRALAAEDPAVSLLSFSRNFGHEAASTAGLDYARGDAVILIDADLQDPPELIPTLVERWRAGADVVYAQRRRRAGESPVKRLTAHLFYRILSRLTETPIPPDTGDFRLMDRRVVEALRQCRESPRFVRGLVSWVGFKQVAVPYDRDARYAGDTKYNYRKLARLAGVAISSFSLLPLRLSMHLGLIVLTISLLLAAVIVVQRFVLGVEMLRGYAFLTCSIFFLGGVQLVMLGILSHYLGQLFTRAQARPLYIVADTANLPAARTLHGPPPAANPFPHAPDALPRDGRPRDPVLVVRREAGHHPAPPAPVP